MVGIQVAFSGLKLLKWISKTCGFNRMAQIATQQTKKIEVLKTKFEGRVFSGRNDVNWPPRSCYLTPFDFFLWGLLKGKVYTNTQEQFLKYEIRRVIDEIEPVLRQNVIENFVKKTNECHHDANIYWILFSIYNQHVYTLY